MKVEISQMRKINLPSQCVLCFEKATEKDFDTINDQQILYCKKCHEKVERLRNFKDRIFFISLIFGVLGAILAVVARIAQEGFISLLTGSMWFATFGSGFIFMGMVYLILSLLFLPFLLIFHSKFSRPGIKFFKSKKPNILRLKFKNDEYAKKFYQMNNLDCRN